MKQDITDRNDIIKLVDRFYDKVNGDDLLSPVFNDFAGVNWDTHLPIMYRFWETLLFDTITYQGQPFLKHLPLPTGREHYKRWIELFYKTIDENFEGAKAEEAKYRAGLIAQAFQSKIKSINEHQLNIVAKHQGE